MRNVLSCLWLALMLSPIVEAQPNTATPALELQQKLTKPTFADASFVEKSTLGSLSEIELSKLALNKSKSGPILAFAQRMIDDHTAALNQIGSIAKNNNLQVPMQPDQAHEQIIRQLSTLSEPQFKKAFSKQMQEDNDRALALFATAASDKYLNPQLKDLAANMLPTLQNHQRAAHDLDPH